jgi:hypothetical protein
MSESDARRAGYVSRQALLGELKVDDDALVFRIGLTVVGPDPRIALRETIADAQEHSAIKARLDRFDRVSDHGAWTRATLRLIDGNPGFGRPSLPRVLVRTQRSLRGKSAG